MSVTHVAGPVVGFEKLNRGIQRCAVCGEKLRDNLNEAGPVGPNGEPPVASYWAEGALVQYSGENPQRQSVVGDFVKDDLPDDFCLQLVE